MTGASNKIRRIASVYNADRPDLFTRGGLARLKKLEVSCADRFVLEQLLATRRHFAAQLSALDNQLRAFARSAPAQESEARAVLRTIPGVGEVTVDVVVSEGSRLLRWILVEAAWQLVYRTRRWRAIFEAFSRRMGKKKAIVAVARRLLCMMTAMWRAGRAYQPALVA